MVSIRRLLKCSSIVVLAFAASGCVVAPWGWGHGRGDRRYVEGSDTRRAPVASSHERWDRDDRGDHRGR